MFCSRAERRARLDVAPDRGHMGTELAVGCELQVRGRAVLEISLGKGRFRQNDQMVFCRNAGEGIPINRPRRRAPFPFLWEVWGGGEVRARPGVRVDVVDVMAIIVAMDLKKRDVWYTCGCRTDVDLGGRCHRAWPSRTCEQANLRGGWVLPPHPPPATAEVILGAPDGRRLFEHRIVGTGI